MRIVVGTMTGTSMDAIDAVAVEIVGHGLAMQATFVALATQQIESVQQRLRTLAAGDRNQGEMDAVGLKLGQLTGAAIAQLGIKKIDLIALHGQTIWHDPPESIQLIDPTPIVGRFNCRILTDPRMADLNLGGQGAPITPLADWIMFRSEEKNTAVVNLGGFCNITLLPKQGQPRDVEGFDLCCCNLVLDAIARDRLQSEFDWNGDCAMRGTVEMDLYGDLKAKLQQQRSNNRSLGSLDDLGGWILERSKNLATKHVLATATSAVGSCISDRLVDVERVLVAGGGIHNAALLQAIGCGVITTDEVGIPAQAREAMAMAILGALSQDGVSITLAQITGRHETTEVVGWVQASP